jgi:hypothetical protein
LKPFFLNLKASPQIWWPYAKFDYAVKAVLEIIISETYFANIAALNFVNRKL